jgi:hypothetical protein
MTKMEFSIRPDGMTEFESTQPPIMFDVAIRDRKILTPEPPHPGEHHRNLVLVASVILNFYSSP